MGRKRLAAWLGNRAQSGEVYNKWRGILVDVWDVAIIDELTTLNEAALIPKKSTSKKLARKPHWTYLWPTELGRAFQKAREATGIFDGWPTAEKPGFHEIRSLGGRLIKELGHDEKCIQSLMTHSDKKTTTIYLETPDKLTESDFRPVNAYLTLAQARRIDL